MARSLPVRLRHRVGCGAGAGLRCDPFRERLALIADGSAQLDEFGAASIDTPLLQRADADAQELGGFAFIENWGLALFIVFHEKAPHFLPRGLRWLTRS